MLYFAYGSNLDIKRMVQRCPSAKVRCVASVSKYQFGFRKLGVDGTGKASIKWTGNSIDKVHGVVYEISIDDFELLDMYEGNGVHYKRIFVKVRSNNGKRIKAVTYIPVVYTNNNVKPAKSYKKHIVKGAICHKLPDWYVIDIALCA